MPVYEYYCPANGKSVEVEHAISREKLKTWGEVCELAGVAPGKTPADSPVERLIFPVQTSTPMSDSRLKDLGFTKLVKREQGVYENVTRSGTEKRYMKKGDPSSLPHIHKKVGD
jgi:hypothetical protein